jgi:ketosteroid isomerase-like protein
LAAAVPGAADQPHRIIEGAGHVIQEYAPDACVDVILELLERTSEVPRPADVSPANTSSRRQEGADMSGTQIGSRTAEEEANVAAARAWIEGYNAQEEGWFDRFYAEEATLQTYGPWAQQGIHANRHRLKELIADAARMFPDRTMTLRNLVAEGDTIVMETEWVGTAAETHPTFQSGKRQVLRNIVFNRFRDGKIIETREFGVLVSASADWNG